MLPLEGNSLSRPEIEEKALRLAQYSGGVSKAEMDAVIARVWLLAEATALPPFLS
jgi:hypothetical protein